MATSLHSTYQTALRLQSKLSTWLESSGHRELPATQRCQAPPLVLPAPTPILDDLRTAGSSVSVAQRVSTLYLGAAERLAAASLEEYRGTLEGIRDLHQFCDATRSCTLSQGIADSFVATHHRKIRAMRQEVLQHCAKQPSRTVNAASLSCFDPTVFLDFAFSQSQKLTKQDRAILAKVTGRTEKQISVWFQNRRTRSKQGTNPRRKGPQTIDELESALRDQQRLTREHQARQKLEADSGNESHDSGYASGGSCSTSPPTVIDITNMLNAFHISDDDEVVSAPRARPLQKPAARRVPKASAENMDPTPASRRRVAGKPMRVPAQPTPDASTSTPAVTSANVTERPKTRAPRTQARQKRQPADSLARASHSHATSASPQTPQASESTRSMVATYEAEATSSNKAATSRKRPALPSRRPKTSRSTRGVQVSSSSSSGSSVPSLSPSSSRSSSLSSDPFFDLFSSPAPFSAPLPQTEPVYYTKNANGEFVPVTTPIVVRPQIVVPPPVHIGYPDLSLDLESLFDHPELGPVGPQMIAPDSDPRAFSSNILGSTMEPVITTEDFSALLELLSENAGDASTSGTSALDLTSAMPPLQGPPLNAGHDASSIAPIPDPTSLTGSDYDFGSVVWPEFDETSWSQLLGLA